jgi:phenylpyruvate tautomerase PptA (4-oxalocrotonate tautomerase family)
MPLVRIDVTESSSPSQLRQLADAVQEVMEEVFAAPPHDRYQIITQHRPGELICEDTGLGLARSDDLSSCRYSSRAVRRSRSGSSTQRSRNASTPPPAWRRLTAPR